MTLPAIGLLLMAIGISLLAAGVIVMMTAAAGVR